MTIGEMILENEYMTDKLRCNLDTDTVLDSLLDKIPITTKNIILNEILEEYGLAEQE